jgi:hypothetical protein
MHANTSPQFDDTQSLEPISRGRANDALLSRSVIDHMNAMLGRFKPKPFYPAGGTKLMMHLEKAADAIIGVLHTHGSVGKPLLRKNRGPAAAPLQDLFASNARSSVPPRNIFPMFQHQHRQHRQLAAAHAQANAERLQGKRSSIPKPRRLY